VLYLKVLDWRCFSVGFASGWTRGLEDMVRGARGRISSSVAESSCGILAYCAGYRVMGRGGDFLRSVQVEYRYDVDRPDRFEESRRVL
jgi:hypothetical protein